ncbi:MAG: hypothetical protein GC192_10375 [Bacteroidetes bacterium]|nr:hypothetical protein [Bacteroidota bacterium]
MKQPILKALAFAIFLTSLNSCGIGFGLGRKSQNTQISISNPTAEIEPLKRDEYEVLGSTSGTASSSQFYLLFIPIGKHKTAEELYDNAYYEAVEKLPNSDGLLLPRQKVKKLVIPLLIVNYYRRAVEVTGLGISVKGKQQQKK